MHFKNINICLGPAGYTKSNYIKIKVKNFFNETACCGAPYHDGRSFRDSSSSWHTQDKLDEPSNVPLGSETP